MTTKYGIQHTASHLWWSADNRWARNPIAARWFDSWCAAELAALRDLPDRRGEWSVECIPMERSQVG